MSLPVVAPGEQVIELMIPASKVGLIIGKCHCPFFKLLTEKMLKSFYCILHPLPWWVPHKCRRWNVVLGQTHCQSRLKWLSVLKLV